ncbi:MAG: hypothetical protein Q8O95_03900, partial [bacterium]|nr:hypothetical protein [bacterium]
DGIPDTDDYCPSTPSSLASVVNRYGCPKPLASTFDIKPDFHALDLRSLSNLELGVGNYGKIKWSESIPLLKDETENQTTYKTRLSLDNNITFSQNKVTLNPSNLPEMNRQATITLHNISFTEPKIQRDGISCPSTICSNITYDKTEKTLTFTVTGFSTYEVTEGYVPPPSPPSGGGGGSSSTSSTSSSQASSGSSSGGSTLALGSYTIPQDISTQSEPDEFEGTPDPSSCSSSITSSPELFPSLSSALTSSQIQSILNLLLAFQADQHVVNDVHCALLGYEIPSSPSSSSSTSTTPSTPSTPTTPLSYTFTQWLTIGKRSEDVRQLQIWLNNYSPSNSSGQVHPYQVAPSGLDSTGSPQAGSPGLETTYFGPATESALRRLQCDRLSVCSGTPATTGYGATGPRTRSVLNRN